MIKLLLRNPSRLRINRNIVECKYSNNRLKHSFFSRVLIETLWNVNIAERTVVAGMILY